MYKPLRKIVFLFGSCEPTAVGIGHPLSRNFHENTSQPATNTYDLEVVFDPKSAFNYHFSYAGKKMILSFPEYSEDTSADFYY